MILVCNSRCTKDNLTAFCRWQVVLGFLKPPGAGVAGVPLQTLYGFDRVHVPAGKTVAVELYPSLAEKIRVLIYNGDVDTCVPYVGNQEWVDGMVSKGVLKENTPWHPWYLTDNNAVPAGYVTDYDVVAGGPGFSFLTIRLAGHEVPHYTPDAALDLFTRFLSGGKY